MDQVTTTKFRGYAGQVILEFVRPGTIFSAIPVLIFYLIFGSLIYFVMPTDTAALNPFLLLVLSSVPVARFAIPAAKGHFDVGWFNSHLGKGEVIGFVMRYLVLTLCWSIPCGILLWLAGEMGSGVSGSFSVESLANAGFAGILVFIVLFVAIFAPTLSYLICTQTESVNEVLGLEPWRNLVSDERPDLIVFYASLIGGVLVFWLVYAIPFFLLTTISFAINPALGGTVITFVLLLPITMSPILMGRLCGAFVQGHGEMGTDSELEHNLMMDDNPSIAQAVIANKIQKQGSSSTAGAANFSTNPSNKEASLEGTKKDPQTKDSRETPPSAPSPQNTAGVKSDNKSVSEGNKLDLPQGAEIPKSEDMGLNSLLKRLNAVDALKLNNTILLVQNKLKSRPDDPYVAAELVLLHCKAKQLDEACLHAGNALRLCLSNGVNALAAKVFVDIGAGRTNLDLPPDTALKLSEVLIEHGRYAMAAWCKYSGDSRMGVDAIQIQKDVLAFAEQAKQLNKPKQAIAVFNLFLKLFKQSEFEDFVRKELDGLNSG